MAGGSVWQKLCSEKVRSAAIHVDSLFEARGIHAELTHLRIARAFAEGMVLAAYSFNKHRSKASLGEGYTGPTKLVFVAREKSLRTQFEEALTSVQAVGEAVNVTRDWSNEPRITVRLSSMPPRPSLRP